MNEQELIELVKKKDRAAFKILVDTWQDMVYNTALGILQNAEDAEDVSQEVFIQVYESVSSFKGESKFSTWLYRITITKTTDHIRKKKRKKRFAFIQSLYGNNDEQIIDLPDFFHPGISLENKENGAILFKAIEQLLPNQKAAFVLSKLENLSYKEIAEVMNLSEAAVDALLQRAKDKLKKILKNYYLKYSG
ncbi:MAG TPA: RNA polymerase sigma factor [Chitinophagaceae bacterium]|nr:RNA polymerase sigma factor [Chitinophagaceae bacterium]